METIKSVPVYQCANGHVICKICIEKLNNCPICRNDSALVRSLKLENIVEKLEGIQPEKMGPTTAKLKWGIGICQSSINFNHQSNPRQAMLRQATPRQVRRESWIVTNNQGIPQAEIITIIEIVPIVALLSLYFSFCYAFIYYIDSYKAGLMAVQYIA